MKTTLEWARYYVFEKGFSVIPLREKDKRPAIETWTPYQTKRPSEEELTQWFGNDSKNNIGIVTGKISGIAVVDLDSRDAIEFAKRNRFHKTPCVKTGKGLHLYYIYEEGIRNFQKRDDIPDIDLRGDGGYVVAPPSIHPSGEQYVWLMGIDDLPFAELPELILQASPRLTGNNIKVEPKTIEDINSKCQFIKHCYENRETLSEIKWYAMISNLARVTPYGVALCHAYSEGYPQYTRKETEQKILHALDDTNPHTCQYIKETIGFDCGKDCDVKSPIVLLSRDGNQRKQSDCRKAPQVMSRFYPRPFTNELLTEHEFLWEGEKGYLWWYNSEKGIWISNGGDFIKHYFRSTTDAIDDTLKRKYIIDEIVADVQGFTFNTDGLPEPKITLIPFKNRVFDLESGMSRAFQSDDYLTWTLPWNYNPEARCSYLEKLINDTLQPEEVITLLELMAYALWRGYPYQKFFLLVGSGRNGKGTFMTIFTRLLGMDNISNVSLGDLQDNRFAASNLYHKLANMSGEVDYSDLENTRLLKQLTGGDNIQADRKYLNPVKFVNHAKLIFATNQVPITRDTTDAFFRRAFIVDFPKQFRIDPSIDVKIREESEEMTAEYEGLAVKIAQQLRQLIQQNFIFTRELDIEDARNKYNQLSNPLVQFIEEHLDRTYDHEDYIYKYQFCEPLNDWLKVRGFNSYSATKVGREMKELGFEESKKDSPDKTTRYNAWTGIRWRNNRTEVSVQDVQDVKALPNYSLSNIENGSNPPRQAGQVGQTDKCSLCIRADECMLTENQKKLCERPFYE